jgi:oligo-1,6-glucosidase
MMEWWLEKGIDGFRMDVINLISKPPDLPPGDPDEPLSGQLEHTANGPRVHEYLGEMRDRVLAPADRELLTVGETVGAPMPIEHARRYVTEDGLSMIFHFEHVLLDRGDHVWERRDWSLPDLKAVFDRWQDGLEGGGWNSLYLNNHDQPRQVSRFGDDGEYRRESATLLATLLYTLRGTPFVYQGEELGMTNYPFESLAEFRDVDTVHALETAIETGEVSGFDAVADAVRANTRDNARTPMQWSDAAHAGFTSGEPWMPVNPNYERVNADRERAESGSVWHYYRRLVELRGANDVLVYGDYDPLTPAHEDLWVYTRALTDGTERDRLLVALNAAGTPTDYSVPPSLADPDAGCLLANYRHCEGAAVRPPTGTLTLRPWEARVYHSRVPAE